MTFTVTGYRVEQLLGAGSQAEVWVGQSIATGERVALKRIVVDSPATARAARSEAALLAVLDHPSLIQLREFVVTDSAMVLVMELAEAGSLAQLLRRRGRLSPAEVVATVSPVAAALAHAHEQGVLHADVSAANILFTAAGQPKLADLGVARLLAGSGEAIGTPAYVDPVIAAGGAAGAASDVFSLAAVALHALTGTGPWQRPVAGRPVAGRPGSSAPAGSPRVPAGSPSAPSGSPRAAAAGVARVLAVAATGEIAGLAERLAGFVPAIAEVLTRALDPVPDRRGTAAEFALDLRAALTPVPVVLAGGRILSKVGRHSIERRDRERAAVALDRPPFGSTAGAGPGSAAGAGTGSAAGAGTGSVSGLGRGLADLVEVPADLTHQLRPRIRASIAELPVPAVPWWRLDRRWDRRPFGPAGLRGGRWGRERWSSGSWSLGRWGSGRWGGRPVVLLAGIGLAMAAGILLLTGRLPRHAMPAAQTDPAVVAAVSAPAEPGASARPSTAAAPVVSSKPATSLDPAAILAALDLLRSRAYAERRPELLGQVYRSPSLLAQDSAQLSRWVPVGCRLTGLRTSYRDLHVTVTGENRLQLLVTASLPAAELHCGDALRSRTSAAGPVSLELGLVDAGHGFQIATEQLRSAGPGPG